MTTLKMVRTMPNTPMQVGEGCTIYSPGSYVTQHDLEKLHLLLNSLGLAQQVPEKMINAIGAVTGCGPAYVRIKLKTQIFCSTRLCCKNLFGSGVYDHRSPGRW